MSTDILYDESEALILLALLATLLLTEEIGFRFGRRQTHPTVVHDQITSIQGALAGLFALMLGFTFAMALSRYELRRQDVVNEANAIGTAVLRARLLPPEQRVETAELFRRYVATRVETARLPNLDSPEQRQLDAEASRLQDLIWRRAEVAAEADPRSVPAGLLLQAVNEVIDLKGVRDASLAAHVPESVLFLLFAFAALTTGVVGYGNGLAGARSLGAVAILSVLISLVILVIVDLDRPRRGFIQVSKESMLSLQRSLETSK